VARADAAAAALERPVTERAVHWANVREAGVVAGMRFMVAVYRLLGRAVFNLVLYPVMGYFLLRRRTAREASIDYLRRVRAAWPDVLPDLPEWRLSFRHFMAFGQSLLDKYLAWTRPPPIPELPPGHKERVLDLIGRRQGCLILGSHFGNMEYSRGVSARHPELVINVLIYDQHAGKFAEMMAKSQPDSRMHLIQVTDLDLPLALRLREKVENGEWVVIAGDRVPVGEAGRTVTVDFLGAPARFPVGPYVLASLLKCPVYLLNCYRDSGTYRMEFEPFAERLELARDDREAAFARHARRYAGSLESLIRRQPLQWFNFFDFWRQ
jgi:predicted LPLAT superfamily acyltransferase